MFLTMFCKTQNTVQTMHLQRRQTHGRTRAWVCVLWTARLSLTWEDNDTVMWDPAAVEAVNSWGTSHLCHRWLCVRGCAATNNNAVAIRSSSQWTSLTMTEQWEPLIWRVMTHASITTCFNRMGMTLVRNLSVTGVPETRVSSKALNRYKKIGIIRWKWLSIIIR